MLLLSFLPPRGHLKCNWLSTEGCASAALKKKKSSFPTPSYSRFFSSWNKHTQFVLKKKEQKLLQKSSVTCKIGIFKTNLLYTASPICCPLHSWGQVVYCLGLNLHQLLGAKKAEVQRRGLESIGSAAVCHTWTQSLTPLHKEAWMKGRRNMNWRTIQAVLHLQLILSPIDWCKKNIHSLGSGGWKRGSVLVRAPFWPSHRHCLIFSPRCRHRASPPAL